MRLLVLSDIHLEFGPFALPEDLGEFDAAVFAGDVGRPITAAIRWVEQQRRGPLKGRPTIFVPGNHEFYHGEIHLALREGQALAEQCAIHMLAPGCVVVGNVRFIGATLWTDFNLFGKSRTSRVAARHGMNDHRLIHIVENGRRRAFAPEHAVAIHRSELAFIMEQLGDAVGVRVERTPDDELPERLMLASNYAMGLAFELTHRAIENAMENRRKQFDIEDFAAVYARKTGAETPANPFLARDWTRVDPTRLLAKDNHLKPAGN